MFEFEAGSWLTWSNCFLLIFFEESYLGRIGASFSNAGFLFGFISAN